MFERFFYNLVYNDYEILVKIYVDEGDGYEEFFVDKEDGNVYNIYLFIKG